MTPGHTEVAEVIAVVHHALQVPIHRIPALID